MNRSPLRLGFLLNVLALAVAWLAPRQLANAQCPEICDSNNGNTAFGNGALMGDSGFQNTAVGFNALFSNTSGIFNTATGSDALSFNTTGSGNTANGFLALENNTTGNSNTADGDNALLNNATGNNNTAVGTHALRLNTVGSSNIALGVNAGENILAGSNNIDIGNVGNIGESGAIRIGKVGTQTKAFIAGINGQTVPTGVAVIVDTTGHLGTTTSSARFKEAIEPMDKASEAILALKPVTFRYKRELDPDGIPQFGLVAEQVEKIAPELVAHDAEGKPYTVRYEAVNAMLLNEFLKEHKAFVEEQRKVQEQGATIAELSSALTQQQKDFQAAIASLKQTVTAQLSEQATQIQKVSAQLEASKPLLQTIANNQ